MSHTSDMTFLVRAVFTVWTFIWFMQHVWNIDRFKALKWRRIKKFELKSAITILLLLMCPLQAFYDISISVIKYREGYILNPLNGEIVSKPHSFWSETNKALLLPTDYILCASFSVQTCLLFLLQSFWNYLANSLAKTTFMGSFEFKSYIIYSIFSISIFPILQYIFRENDLLTEVVPQLVYSIFMILICILGVRSHWRFTELLKVTKNSSVAQINIVSKLAYFRDMNRYLTFALFIGSISLAALSIDGLTSEKWLNSHKLSSDLLICHLNFSIWIVFVTLFLIFYPSSSTFNDPIQSTTKSSTSASSASSSSNKTFTKNEKSLNPSKWIPRSYTATEEDYVKLKHSSSPWSSQQSHSANDGVNNSYYIDINDDSTVVNVNSNNGGGGSGGGSHNDSNSNYYINNKTDINISSKQLKKCIKQIRSDSLDAISPPPITPPSPYRSHAANEPLTTFKSSPSSSPSPTSPSSPLLPPPVAIPTTANTAQFNFYNSKSTIKTNKSIEVLKYPSSPLTKSTFDINNNNERSSPNSGGIIQSPQKVSTLQLLSPPPFYNNNIRNSSNNDHDDSDDDDSSYFLQKFSNPTTNITLSSPPIAPKKSSKRPSITAIKTKTNDSNYTAEINVKDDVVDNNNNNKKSSNIVTTTRKLTIKFQDDLKSKPRHNLTINTTNVNNVNKSNINSGSDNGNGFNQNTTTPLSNIGATKTASKNQKTKVSSKLITTTITKTLSRPSSIEAQSKSSSSKSSSSKSSSSSPSSSPSPSSPSPTIKSFSKSSSPSPSPSPTIKSPSSKSKKPPPSSKPQQKIGNASKPYQHSPLNPKRSDKPESLKTFHPPITARARSGSSSNVIESNNIRKSVINRNRSNSTNTLNNSNSVLIGGGTRNIFGSASSTKGNANSRGGGGVRGINILGRSRSDSNSSASSSGSSSNESSSSSSSSSSFGDSGNNNGKFRKGILKKKVIKPTRDTVLGVI